MSVLGERIKILREEYKLTQEDVGDKLFVNKGTVSKWENGERIPSHETIIKLANLFNVTTDFLFGLTNKRQPNQITKEDILKIAPEHAWLFEEEGLEFTELFKDLKDKDIPPEAVKETIELILKYKHLNK